MPAKKKVAPESDSTYFLKILLYLVLGLIWLQYNGKTVFPLGMLVGFFLAQHEHFQIDRKVEYAILLIAAIVAAIVGRGFFLNISTLSL